jgi:hypothetical protein
MNTNTNAHRETWLNRLAALMAPKFEELGYPVPKFRVAIGFTGAKKEAKVEGVCWHKSNSADGHFEVFISPDMADPMRVAAILAHEMTHAAVGFDQKHKGTFAKTVAALGMVRPFTSSVAGPQFEAWAKPFLELLGPLPHAPLSFRHTGGSLKELLDGPLGQGEEGEGGSSNDKKKQSTRMLKACCSHVVVVGADGKDVAEPKPCGYTVRLTRKWALELGAACPVHGAMEVEGLEDAQREDEQEGGDEE